MDIKIYDNGGKTFDRYLICIGEDVFSMSHNACSPQGVNMWLGLKSEFDLSEMEELNMRERDRVPRDVLVGIVWRLCEVG